MKSNASLPLLLKAAERASLSSRDRHYIAWALGQVGGDRAIPVLVKWAREDVYQVKEVALSALENIDSQSVALEVRPLFKSEPSLQVKLRVARLLARHGFNDGYALATEHLADQGHTAAATLVLVALDDPRTTDDLSPFLTGPPDRRWRAAALMALAAIAHADARAELLEILQDDRHPMVAEAAEAAGLSGNAELVAPLARLVRSRNRPIALASLLALRRYLTDVRTAPAGLAAANAESPSPAPSVELPSETRNALTDSVAELAADTYLDAELRRQALAVARLLGGDSYTELLTQLADQAELEGTNLLTEVQTARSE
jgi:HEAT repeat protein